MAIIRNHINNDLYRYLGSDKYKNLRTGVEGRIEPERAKRLFKINLEATVILSEYPIIEQLIEKLGLVMDK